MNFYNEKIAKNIAFSVSSSIVDPADLSSFDMHHYVSAITNNPPNPHLIATERSYENTHKNDILWSKRRIYVSKLIARRIILANLNFMEDRDYSWAEEVINQINTKCPRFSFYEYFFGETEINKTIAEVISDIEDASYKETNKIAKYFRERVIKTGSFKRFLNDIQPLSEAGRYLCIALLVAKGIIPYILYKGSDGVKKVEEIFLKEEFNYTENFDYMMLLYQIENFVTQANTLGIQFSLEMSSIWDRVVDCLFDAGVYAEEDEIIEFSFTFAAFCCLPYPFNYINSAVNYALEYLVRDIMHRVELSKTVIETNSDENGSEIFDEDEELNTAIYFKVDSVVDSILTTSDFEKERLLNVIQSPDFEGFVDKIGMEELTLNTEDIDINEDFEFSLNLNNNTEE